LKTCWVFYELLEKRIGKSLEKTLDTTTISYQNPNLSIHDTREIKHEHQEESNNGVYKVEDCNAKQEISSKSYDDFEVLSLDNKNEITNELEEDNKNNYCEVYHYKLNLEGLHEHDKDNNESSLVLKHTKGALVNDHNIIYLSIGLME